MKNVVNKGFLFILLAIVSPVAARVEPVELTGPVLKLHNKTQDKLYAGLYYVSQKDGNAELVKDFIIARAHIVNIETFMGLDQEMSYTEINRPERKSGFDRVLLVSTDQDNIAQSFESLEGMKKNGATKYVGRLRGTNFYIKIKGGKLKITK